MHANLFHTSAAWRVCEGGSAGSPASSGEDVIADAVAQTAHHHPPQLALACLERDGLPRLFVTCARSVIWRNPAADAALKEGAGLDVRDGLLVAEDRAQHALLGDFLAVASPQPATLCLPCMDGDGHWLLIAHALIPGGAAPAKEPPAAISVVARRTGTGFKAAYADFREPFGLTGSEYQVVRMMIDGRTADEIAALTGSSVGTIRTHIRAIYTKMNVSSREMLFYRLRPFRTL